MKAGVYETPNGNLIYVAKDRTVRATSLHPSSWVGTKVSHRSKDDTVLLANEYRCKRHADVPDGCTDHEGLIYRLCEEKARSRPRSNGWRPVGKQAARRHRRKGREVRTDADGQRWWRA